MRISALQVSLVTILERSDLYHQRPISKKGDCFKSVSTLSLLISPNHQIHLQSASLSQSHKYVTMFALLLVILVDLYQIDLLSSCSITSFSKSMSSTLREGTLKNSEPWIISIGIATSSPSEAFQGVWAKPFRAWSHRSARWTTVKQFEEEGGAEDEDQNEDKEEDEDED